MGTNSAREAFLAYISIQGSDENISTTILPYELFAGELRQVRLLEVGAMKHRSEIHPCGKFLTLLLSTAALASASVASAIAPPVMKPAPTAKGCMSGQIEDGSLVFSLPEGKAKFTPIVSGGSITGATISFDTTAPVFGEKESQTRVVNSTPHEDRTGSIGLVKATLDEQSGVLSARLTAGLGMFFPASGGWTAAVISRSLNCLYILESNSKETFAAFPEGLPFLTNPAAESAILIADISILNVAQAMSTLRATLQQCESAANTSASEIAQLRARNTDLEAQIAALHAQLAERDATLAELRNQIAALTDRLATLSRKTVYSVSSVSKRIGRALFKLSLRLPTDERAKARKTYRRLQGLIRRADQFNADTATQRGDSIIAANKKTLPQ